MTVDFAKLMKGRRASYAERVDLVRRGLLSLGHVWFVAETDEVFAAYLKKQGIEKP